MVEGVSFEAVALPRACDAVPTAMVGTGSATADARGMRNGRARVSCTCVLGSCDGGGSADGDLAFFFSPLFYIFHIFKPHFTILVQKGL